MFEIIKMGWASFLVIVSLGENRVLEQFGRILFRDRLYEVLGSG